MRTMTSQEIHKAIEVALIEVSRALASGAIDRRGRYYSDSELRERFGDLSKRRTRQQTFPVKRPA